MIAVIDNEPATGGHIESRRGRRKGGGPSSRTIRQTSPDSARSCCRVVDCRKNRKEPPVIQKTRFFLPILILVIQSLAPSVSSADESVTQQWKPGDVINIRATLG